VNTLQEMLKAQGIDRALVVDDGYDLVPRASELAVLDAVDWVQFFEDLEDEDVEFLRSIFPAYDQMPADELRASDLFVKTLWENHGKLPQALTELVFGRFLNDRNLTLETLEKLTELLHGIGIESVPAGREFHNQAMQVDLIVIDLFMGATQAPSDMNTSLNGLMRVIRARSEHPPMVILMSSSPQLADHHRSFRENSGMFASSFRYIHKSDLRTRPKRLERVLDRLVRHREESLKLARFLHAWEHGTRHATERTAKLIRSLDLQDHAQVKLLLLNAEGESLGGYAVDVFDQVLQHEVERETTIIESAKELNTLDVDSFPPASFASSPDLQNLMYRTLFQHPVRLGLTVGISFGDLIRMSKTIGDPGFIGPIREAEVETVWAVMTPACDLRREKPSSVLLVPGHLKPLNPTVWNQKTDSVQTPVVELEGKRYFIEWDLKHLRTFSFGEIQAEIEDVQSCSIVARLRESHALQIQQRLLADLGRVGQLALMPATVGAQVHLCIVGIDGKLKVVLDNLEGVIYTGRKKKGDSEARLLLPETVCEEICTSLQETLETEVHRNALSFFRTASSAQDLSQTLASGLLLDKRDKFKVVSLISDSAKQVGVVVRQLSLESEVQSPQNAGFVLLVFESSNQ
jgi:CheY-like chemotaxis protein